MLLLYTIVNNGYIQYNYAGGVKQGNFIPIPLNMYKQKNPLVFSLKNR